MQSRLFEIIYHLMDGKGSTAKDLARRFEVSVRTIYRDIDALSAAGIPIYAKKGKGGGIFLMEGYTLDKAVLTERERNDVLIGLQSIAATGYEEGTLQKLKLMFQQQREWIVVDFTGWGADEAAVFDKVKKAVQNQNIIAFDYYNSNGQNTHRCAEPMQLVFKARNWYLFAYCRKRLEYRVFRFSRIKNIEIMPERFERDFSGDAFEYLSQDTATSIKIKLLIDACLAHRVYDEFDLAQVTKMPDGSYEVLASMPENEWLYGYVLSFGQYVRVLEPPHLKVIIKKRLTQALINYE